MKKSVIQKLVLITSDGLALCASLILAVYVLNFIRPGAQEYIDFNRLGIAKLFGFSLLIVFWQQEHYTKRRPTWEEIKLLFETIFIFAIIHFCLTYLVAHHIVKLVNAVFWVLLLFVLPFFRYISRCILLKLNLWQREIYIVGIANNAKDALKILQQNRQLGYNIIGFITLSEGVSSLSNINNIPVYTYNQLSAQKKSIDTEVIFALEPEELALNAKMIDIMQKKYTFVSVIPDSIGLPLYGAQLDHFFGSNQVLLRLKNNLSRRINRVIKRACDIVLSICGLVLLSPVFMAFMLLILCSGNKVFFRHKRIGRAGKHFYCLKFQTMYANAAEILEKVLLTDKNAKEEWEKDFKLKHDPRVTKIGDFLRKTSLDEIPQLWNVLKGDMSLIGPRPIIDAEIEKYNDDFYYYKLVRPGVTGLWQISGRNDVDYQNRVRLDVWYVKNWSLWYDFVIILRTVVVVLARKGAY
ncbi:MAG: undecaprenyl-phosphate galactose phosphotransferase WbaP [Proteobacteria bacterium]|jgi:Undecaprenyl-phosphate galactose phosphotransferase WbaP|nr:undecaprenyl-phosphate galactose phosphotransferase WbaP [Pseudomonadota bacterium]